MIALPTYRAGSAPAACLLSALYALLASAFAGRAYAQQTCALSNADFKRTVLYDLPAEPMKLTVLPDGRVVWTEKRGAVRMWLPANGSTVTAGTLNVFWTMDEGLHGIAQDPDFANNHFLYLAYDPKSDNAPAGPGRWLSRFTLNGNVLDLASEKKLLHVEIERDLMDGCCHQGGALAFDKQGNLFWSIGEQSDYRVLSSLTDERGRHQNSLRSAGNSNDLRGKIVRIHPEANGTYTVPAGNLFPPGLAKTRPEIYAMGVRNPFSLQVDPKTGWLWEGEVGTDATVPSADKGAVGYDEINLLTHAAHLGYPFVNGPNDPFNNYDWVNSKPLGLFDPDHLVNNSKFNTGLVDLAPAGKPQPALIYWTVRKEYSKTFAFGDGKTAALAGPTYRFDPALSNSTKLPAWLDGKVFFVDHEREIIRVLTLGADQKPAKIDSFMTNGGWSGIVDLQQGPNGSLYVAEYGHGYYTANPTAKISRIDYIGQPCGTVAMETPAARSRRSPQARLAYADPAVGVALSWPAGAHAVEALSLQGKLLWRGTEGDQRVPAEKLAGSGVVLLRFE